MRASGLGSDRPRCPQPPAERGVCLPPEQSAWPRGPRAAPRTLSFAATISLSSHMVEGGARSMLTKSKGPHRRWFPPSCPPPPITAGVRAGGPPWPTKDASLHLELGAGSRTFGRGWHRAAFQDAQGWGREVASGCACSCHSCCGSHCVVMGRRPLG